MKKLLLSALTAATVMGVGGTAVAATTCTTKYLTGVWAASGPLESDAICVVQFKTNGWITQSICFDRKTLKPVGSMTGRFTSTKSCDVTGDFDFATKSGKKKMTIKFKGKFDPKAGVLRGEIKSKGTPAYEYSFIQQWN